MATNKKNGKRYIGVTQKGMHGRRARHEDNALKGVPGRFYDAIRKHGLDAFIWTVLCTRKGKAEAYRREFLYVDALKPEYNVAPGGICPSNNRVAVMCLEDGLVFESAQAAAKHYSGDLSEVRKAVRGIRRIANGRHFIRAEVSLTEDERISLIQKIDAEFVVRRCRVEKRIQTYRGVIEGRDAKGRRATGPQKNSIPVICLDDGNRFPSINEAARFYDVDSTAVSELCRGKRYRKTVGGKLFKYAEDDDGVAS